METRRSETQPGGLVPILPPASDTETAFRHAYAILVRGKAVRRHLFLSLPAAERAVRRAHGRGDSAEMILVELVPVAKAGDRHE